MCSDGVLKVIGGAQKKWHGKNIVNNRVSITTVQIDKAAGNKAPMIFIAKEKYQTSLNRIFTNDRLTYVYTLPLETVRAFTEII